MLRQLIGKVTLRAFTVLSALMFFYGVLGYVLWRSDVRVVVKGEIDVSIFVGFLTGSLLTLALTWLFKEEKT